MIFIFLQISYVDGACELEISEVYPEDDGSYTCMASNSAGDAKTTARMIVKGNWFFLLLKLVLTYMKSTFVDK